MASKQNLISLAIERCEEITRPDLKQKEVTQLYDKWAENYDQDLEIMGKDRTRCIVKFVTDLVKDKNARILDAACGTGLVGQALHDCGYTHIDGIDCSASMLKVAKEKHVYTTLFEDYLGPSVAVLQTDSYDFIICAGGLTATHVKDDAFEELIRVTKPGGLMTFTTSTDVLEPVMKKYEKRMQQLDDEQKWNWKLKDIINNYGKFDNSPSRDNTGTAYVFEKP